MRGSSKDEAIDPDECLKRADYAIIEAISHQTAPLLKVRVREDTENTVVHSAALAEAYRAPRFVVSGSPACHRMEIHQDHSDDIRNILMRSKHVCLASVSKYPPLRLPHE